MNTTRTCSRGRWSTSGNSDRNRRSGSRDLDGSTSAAVVVGIGGTLGHDSNAAVLVDGWLAAASQEERYTRLKHDDAFPEQAIRDCLSVAGRSVNDVDVCVFAEKPFQEMLATRTDRPSNRLTWLLGRLIPERTFPFLIDARRLMPRATFCYAWHHLCHAGLAFAAAPFERAAFLCVDGRGDDVNATIGTIDGAGVEIHFELGYANGLGMFYTLVTEFLGFGPLSEYKVMGLAPYGKPAFADRLRAFVSSDANGALRFNLRRRTWEGLLRDLAGALGIAQRRVGDEITDAHADLAASVQSIFEEHIFKMANFAGQMTGQENLLFCGGCAQNCVAAAKLEERGIFSEVFTSPAAGDMGTGLGAAVLYRRSTGRLAGGKIDIQGLRLGSTPGPLPADALPYRVGCDDVFDATARLLAEGAIVGWVRGRMEYGARALGARSILADPRVADMQSTLNQKTKGRESFRPFAPAILAEEVSAWFDTRDRSDYMQRVASLKPARRFPGKESFRGWQDRLSHHRCAVPAVVHVDYSSRLQTVAREQHPDLHRLLTRFKELTGIPMLINTSFNVSGEPIVRTAEDAWRCFTQTRMDYLVVGDALLRHPRVE